MTDYGDFVRALATPDDQPMRAFDALCALAVQVVGVKLFTVMVFDEATGTAQRKYSNMPAAYPVSGCKPANRTHWSQIVMEERRIFVANDYAGIREVFFDHDLIRSLGCESVINVPVEAADEVIGTINCLDVAGHYTEARVRAAEALKLPGAACLLLNSKIATKGAN
jgi:GAF domain-containing protein